MSLSFVHAVLSVQYRGPRARGIQTIPQEQQNEKSEWTKTLHDFDCIQLNHPGFKPVKYEVFWGCGRMVVTWQFDRDNKRLEEFRSLVRSAEKRLPKVKDRLNIHSLFYEERSTDKSLNPPLAPVSARDTIVGSKSRRHQSPSPRESSSKRQPNAQGPSPTVLDPLPQPLSSHHLPPKPLGPLPQADKSMLPTRASLPELSRLPFPPRSSRDPLPRVASSCLTANSEWETPVSSSYCENQSVGKKRKNGGWDEPPQQRQWDSHPDTDTPSEITLKEQEVQLLRALLESAKDREEALIAKLEAEKEKNGILRGETDDVRSRLSKVEGSREEEHRFRKHVQEKLEKERRHRLQVEKALEEERSMSKVLVTTLEAERQRQQSLNEVLTRRLKEEVGRRLKAEGELGRLEEERDYPFVVPAVKEAFDHLLGLSQQAQAELKLD